MPWEWDAAAGCWRDGDTTCEAIPPVTTTALLNERGQTHGQFSDNARTGQLLRALFRASPGWHAMPDVHKEALDMIATKLSRILSGQSRHKDHFADIAGYASLAMDACDGD